MPSTDKSCSRDKLHGNERYSDVNTRLGPPALGPCIFHDLPSASHIIQALLFSGDHLAHLPSPAPLSPLEPTLHTAVTWVNFPSHFPLQKGLALCTLLFTISLRRPFKHFCPSPTPVYAVALSDYPTQLTTVALFMCLCLYQYAP